MRFWIVKASDEKLYKIGSNKKPNPRKYLEVVQAPVDELTGEFEDAEWLQIEDIEVSPGIFERKATVNELLKQQILDQRQADKDQADQEAEKEKKNLRDVKKAIKKIKMENLNNAQNIKMAIVALKNAVLAIEKKLINIQED